MMLQQQDTGVKPPDGSLNGKVAKQKGGLGASNIAATNGGTTPEQQPQRCPRCDSVNTKFCYYNNYSTTQPRHFCKNCRRYWTKGGALRNVPIGGGCRKNKRLKHRDPSSCLAALAEMDASGSSNILASISGCGIPGFGPSTSSLIQDLAHEGHRQLALSRLAGMQVFDKRFMAENEHNHQGGMPTQDLFALGAGNGAPSPAFLGHFDPSSFPALNYARPDSQPLLFHPHHASHELTPFFDSMSATSPMLTPTLDQLSAFTSPSGTAPVSHHVSGNSMGSTGSMDSQLMHHNIQMNGIPASHELHSHEDQQQHAQAHATGGGFSEETVEMSMARSKSKSLISSLSDWAACATQHQSATTSTEALYNVHPPQANDNSLWNVSWPEMHAVLAGSTAAAGAMLH
ncbi:hypothetical protein L7F22_008228 [Adiantum nelumboides]|nr:hypothetical protein [Adiantum nelumboides]